MDEKGSKWIKFSGIGIFFAVMISLVWAGLSVASEAMGIAHNEASDAVTGSGAVKEIIVKIRFGFEGDINTTKEVGQIAIILVAIPYIFSFANNLLNKYSAVISAFLRKMLNLEAKPSRSNKAKAKKKK